MVLTSWHCQEWGQSLSIMPGNQQSPSEWCSEGVLFLWPGSSRPEQRASKSTQLNVTILLLNNILAHPYCNGCPGHTGIARGHAKLGPLFAKELWCITHERRAE